MFENTYVITCSNPDCQGGKVEVFYAHSPEPFTPVNEPCEICQGRGTLFVTHDIPVVTIH